MDMIKSCINFGDLDLIFKVTARLNPPNLSQKVFVCMSSHGPLDGILPNLQTYINRTGSIAYSPPKERGHIVFGADPFGVGVSVSVSVGVTLSYMHDIS